MTCGGPPFPSTGCPILDGGINVVMDLHQVLGMIDTQ